MLMAIKKGTTQMRSIGSKDDLRKDEVLYTGEFNLRGVKPLMIWDEKLGNVRHMTDKEKEKVK